jgi:hypothetical protein
MIRKIIFLSILMVASTFAQNQNWNSFLTFTQNPSPYYTDWERNPNIASLNITYLGSEPIEFYFEVVLTIDGYGEAIRGRTENREYSFGPITEILTFNDISDWKDEKINSELENLVIQTGKLPESDYEVCVSTYAASGELLTEACTQFQISLPEAPHLIAPENEASIDFAQPTFMWNPVVQFSNTNVEYHLKIVKILEGQTPYRAIQANVPVLEEKISVVNMYVYALDNYPLEENNSYAWQIQAVGEDGVPISENEGYSEIWEFTYGSKKGDLEIESLMIVEDFAYLIDINDLDIADHQTYLKLDGSCRMLFKSESGVDKFVNVYAQNLMLQKADEYKYPTFIGGSITGAFGEHPFAKNILGEFFKPTEFEFTAPRQFSVMGNFSIGENIDIPLEGRLDYFGSEFVGELSKVSDTHNPIFEFGDESFKLIVSAISLNYPSLDVNLESGLSIFGTSSNCGVKDIELNNSGDFSANIDCIVSEKIELLKGSNLFNMSLKNIEGEIFGNILDNKVDYSVYVSGGLNFNINPDNYFGADVVYELQPDNFKLISFDPNVSADASNIDFGWVKWNMKNIKLNKLEYKNSNWDFDLSMDIDISFPDFSDTKLPTISGISFTPQGFNFPKISFKNFSIPNIDFQAFELELYGFSSPAFTFDLSKFTPGSIAQMSFDWNVKFNMPNLPNGTDDNFKFPNWDLKAKISDGNFNLDFPKLNFPNGYNINLLGGTLFKVKSFSGKLNTVFDGSLMSFLPNINIGGEITLPEALRCDGEESTLKLKPLVNLNGNGSISGIIEDVVPKCPINIGLASLYMKNASIEFKSENGQKIYLDGTAGIKFTEDPQQQEVGNLTVIYEVLNNEIVKAEGKINEKFSFDLAGENPTFSFEIGEAEIKNKNLIIDGRAKLNFEKGNSLGATFDRFKFDLNDYIIKDGRIIFDEPFAMVVDQLENSNIHFTAVNKGDIPQGDNYLYFELPDKISIDKNGFVLDGKSVALLNYQGKKFDGLTADFGDDFMFSLAPFKVENGKCNIFLKKDKVGYFNADGFFPDPNYFIRRVIPDKIPLPALEIAYLQIKENDNLLVDVQTEGNSTRFTTRNGAPINLVFPSLQYELPEAPKILVNFDIAFNDATGEITDGYIRGAVPQESIPIFDLTRVGIPFTIYSIYYGDIDGIAKFRLSGKAKLFGAELACQDSLQLTISQTGILEGNIACDVNQVIPLIPDSDKLNLHINNVAGDFNANLLSRNFDFDLRLDSDLRFNMSENEFWGVWTLLGMDFDGLRLIDHRIDDVAIPPIDLERFKIGISNFTLGRLNYFNEPNEDGNSGWDFEFGMNLNLDFPDLGLKIPNIPNVTLDMDGFHTLDRISIPSFPDSLGFEFQGVELKPLAFRMPRLNFNWFNPLGGNEGGDWDFDIDFEINFPNMQGSSGAMRYPRLTMLDASFVNGMIIGNIDWLHFDLLDGLKLNFGDGFGFSVTGISGRLFDDNGSQGIGFDFKGHLDLPEYMRCDGEETSVDLTETIFSITSRGYVAGVVDNFVPRCPIDLGFGHFVVTSSSINFSVSDTGQVAILDMTGDLVIDTGEDNTVTANGMLKMDLLTGEIIDGSITIEEPFVWAIPKEKPVLRFTINRAVLDMEGLTIDGDGDLLLPGGQIRRANFRNFKFDYRNYKVKSGSLEIDADFAIKLAVENGQVVWSTILADTPLTENKTAKIGFSSNLILDANGLSTSGEAVAAIRWDDDPAHQFENLKIRYSNDFKFSLRPFKVSEGRADLIHMQGEDENIIATLTHDGLNLGDIFGLIPLPEIIPLPHREIAYLRIKSGDRVLVASETTDEGNLRIISTQERPATLVLPSLKMDGQPVDSMDCLFDIYINPASGEVVSGEISLTKDDSLSIINLRNRGIPADIFKIHYGKLEGNYQLTADVQIDLPNMLSGMPIKLRKVRFDNNGLSGNINLGSYSEIYPVEELETLSFTNIGSQAVITLEGVDVEFGENKSVGFSGKFIPLAFASGDDTTDVQYSANWNQEEGKFAFTFDFADGETFNFGVGTFTPLTVNENPAMELSFSEDNFELLINGIFRANQFGSDFNIAIENLRISKNGVSADNINKQAGELGFKLFNSDFRIFGSPAIRFSYTDNIFKMTLSGDITLFGKQDRKISFTDFTIGTDGTFSIGEAGFLNADWFIVDNYIALNDVAIRDNKLAIGGWVKLPEPVSVGGEASQFNFGFNISADGTITADQRIGNKIVLIDEPRQMGNGDETEYDFWNAKFDLTYLALEFNFEDFLQSELQMISDIYWNDDSEKRVSLGDKSDMNNITPGFEINFAGNIQWGSAAVNGDFVDFDEDMFKIKMTSVELSGDENNNLNFGLAGEFGLNFDAIEGGLNLAGFTFNKSEIVSIGRITGGTLTIEDVGSITLNNIGYSDSRTQIWVKGGEMPGADGGNPNADSTQITVNNYLSFGGEITIDGFGSAGVDRFLSYETENSYTLLMQNAHFEIEGTMNASIDLLYSSGDAGFMMRAGGSATIADFDVIVVGKIANINNQVSWGFFVATDIRIDITPIVITGVGGGFFYNPTADDILAVKRLANVGSSSGKIAVQGASFAIFLFGQAAIIDDIIIYGRTLITVTDRQFMLDGQVEIFDMGNKLKGEIHVMVQWHPTFEAEGEITLNVDVARIAKGNGKMGFYVYSSDQWAIYGESTIKLFNYLETNSEFFIGNTGFMVGMSSSVDFDIWIIEVGAGIEVKVWYMRGESWGAFAKAWVKAEMLWGVAKAKGWLQCALIGSEGNAYLYGQAGLEIHVLFTDWSGSAWAKISNGELSGDRGSDSDMDALIAEAAGQSEAASAEMDAMKASIENRPPPEITYSDEELLEMFDRLTELGRMYKYGTQAEMLEAGRFFHLLRVNETEIYQFLDNLNRPGYEYPAVSSIIDIYKGTGAPDLTEYENNKQSVDSLIALYSDALSEVAPLLDAEFETIDQIESSIAQTADDPTIGTTFAEYTIDENGNYQRTNNPSMNLDESIANSNKNNMESAERTLTNYKNEVISKLALINENIGIVENAISGVGNNNSGGLESTATQYASLITKVSTAYKTEFKYSRELELWARDKKVIQGGTDRARFITNLSTKSRNVYDSAVDFGVLRTLALSRLNNMNRLLGKSNAEVNQLSVEEQGYWFDELDKVRNNDNYSEADFRIWATNRTTDIGTQLWHDIPNLGLESLINECQTSIRNNHTNRTATMESMADVQGQFTNKLNNLYYALADLSETKYDILTQLIHWEERDADPNKPATVLNQLRDMKNELSAKMEVPTISSVVVGEQDRGIYSYGIFQWRISGNRIMSLINFDSRNPNLSSNGYLAVGGARRFTLYYTPLPSQTNFGRTTFKVKARNQVGYTIHRSLEFTPSFSNRNEESSGGIIYNRNEVDTTPPYMGEFLGMNYLWRILENDPTKMMVFVSDSSTLSANWTGRDAQTGIQEYKYQLINVSNPEANSPYQYPVVNNNNLAVDMAVNVGGMQIPGIGGNDNEEDEYANWTSNLGRDNVALNNLELEHGRVYQLQVVAKNGEGLYSETIGGRKQFIFADLTPPTKPSFPNYVGYEYRGGGYSFGNSSYSVAPLVDYDDLHTNFVDKHLNDFDNSGIEKNISWLAAEDPESNILRYEMQITNMSDESIASNWINVGGSLERTLTNNIPQLDGMLNYIDTFKVSVRAVNRAKRAGKSSDKLIKITDLTAPTRPTVVGTYTAVSNRAVLAFSQHSRDNQSGVTHYEVAFGSRANGTMDYLSWENAIKIPMNSISHNGRYSITIPNNTESYIAVRGVNREGLKSSIAYTGPFYQDNTKPLTPTVTADVYNMYGGGKALALDFDNVNDPESGIDHVQYRLLKKVSGSNAWQSVIYWRAAETNVGQAIQLGDYNIGHNTDLRIVVRSMNTVGLLSITNSIDYRLPDETPPVMPTVSIGSGAAPAGMSIAKGTKGALITFRNINDPESGISRIEYKIEKVSSNQSLKANKAISHSYSIIQNWVSNGANTTKGFLYSDYRLNSGDEIRVSVRTVNGDELVSDIRRETHELN